MSQDESIIHSFICKNTDQFYKIENLFYEQYQNYAETENSFFLNGHKIKRHKNLEEDKINNNDIITIISNT